MKTLGVLQLPEMFRCVGELFAEKKEELCEMDAKMGDGDLGLTMSKGYTALPDLLKDNAEDGDVGKTLAKGGMKMSSVVPSTMGT
ncbi:MAG: DAK2 domain-containing protein, partial [Lachnospiraceae bacterium]|nr:DAK2 domain-containing protein [Lachnospiraceae bacterium]